MKNESSSLVNNASGPRIPEHEITHHTEPPHVILFLISSIFMGALVSIILKKINIPYTVVLLILGCMFGFVSLKFPELQVYTVMSHTDPHLIFHIFLPVLLFESAMSMDVHTFIQSLAQVLLLSSVGMILSTVLTACLAIRLFSAYNWSWTDSMLFGSILSATDPVAVVSILKELGTSEKLTVIIEGESLLNDGSAIVIFNVILSLMNPGAEISFQNIFFSFIRTTVGGTLFGFTMGKIAVFCLSHIFNEAIVEITVTLVAAYMTFYVGEVFLKVSGILAVVILGLVINSRRTSISPEIEETLHLFWSTLAYLANTLIFVIVGVTITEKASVHFEKYDCFYMVALYFGLNLIRGVMIVVLSPFLRRFGYGMTWKYGVVMAWGGLRGAIGLCLALLVAQNQNAIGHKILAHCSGIVMLTLLINATTIKSMIDILGMSDISQHKKENMAKIFNFLSEEQTRSINTLKMDRFLADANWEMVETSTQLKNPYLKRTDDEYFADFLLLEKKKVFEEYNHQRSIELSRNEMAEMREEARYRVLKSEKESYWNQYEHGMITRKAMHILGDVNAKAIDKKNAMMTAKELKKYWKISNVYKYLRSKLENLKGDGQDDLTTPPDGRIRRIIFLVASSHWFEILMYGVVLLNMIPIILEFTLDEDDHLFNDKMDVLEKINLGFFIIYLIETSLKIYGFGFIKYIRNHWNKIDFVILLLSLCDITVELVHDILQLDGPKVTLTFLNLAKVLRFSRAVRIIRLFRPVIPKLIAITNSRINFQLQIGYDVGRGFIVGEDSTKRLIDKVIHIPEIASELKNSLEHQKLEVLKELGHLQESHPGVALSVKTRQAIRSVLNHTREVIHDLKDRGQLDENEHKRLKTIVEGRMKKMVKIPASIEPPSPSLLLKRVPWIDGDYQLLQFFLCHSKLKNYNEGDIIARQGNQSEGIDMIVSGMVKLVCNNQKLHLLYDGMKGKPGELPNTDSYLFLNEDETQDFISSGNVLGEVGVLNGKPRNSTAICETATQLFHVPVKIMKNAFVMFQLQPNLENKIWRCCAQRIAEHIMINHEHYTEWTLEQIQLHLDQAFMPDLNRHDTFNIYKGIEEVIIIQGNAIDAHSRESYYGPVLLPKTVRKLLFQTQSNESIPRMLVVPNPEYASDQKIQFDSNEFRRPSNWQLNTSTRRMSRGINDRRLSLLAPLADAKSNMRLNMGRESRQN